MLTFYLIILALILFAFGVIYAKVNGEEVLEIIDMRIWYDEEEGSWNFEFHGITNYFALAGFITLITSVITGLMKL